MQGAWNISIFPSLPFFSFLFFARSFSSVFLFRGKEEGIDEERSVSRRLKQGNKRRRRKGRRRRRTSMNRGVRFVETRNLSTLVFLSASLRKWQKGRGMHSFIAKSFRLVRGIRMKSLRQEVSNKLTRWPPLPFFFETRIGLR